jgi:ribosome biogenesis ATPase
VAVTRIFTRLEAGRQQAQQQQEAAAAGAAGSAEGGGPAAMEQDAAAGQQAAGAAAGDAAAAAAAAAGDAAGETAAGVEQSAAVEVYAGFGCGALSPAQLAGLSITMSDFEAALPKVQPSVRREGGWRAHAAALPVTRGAL